MDRYMLHALLNGEIIAPRVGPFKVFQRDRFIGTVPAFPVRSTSFIFDVRPTDFTFAERDGEEVLFAANMIGPGDFDCIAGFVRANGAPAEKGEVATLFDAMVKLAQGTPTRRAETTGSVGEADGGPVAESDAPEQSPKL